MKQYRLRYEVERDPEKGEFIAFAESATAVRRKFEQLKENDAAQLLTDAASEDPQYYYIKVIDVNLIK